MAKWMSVVFSLMMLLGQGCGENANNPQNGTLRAFLTDAVGGYEAVHITFTEISAHLDTQWVILSKQMQTVNLLEWNNGKTLLLGQAEVEAGKYTQIRLKIASAEIVLNGKTYPLTVPSGVQSGLKLLANFEVAAGSTYDIVLDFDVERSIVATGPRGNPGSFKLKPTIRVAAMALTGSISGNVTNPADLPVAYALAGSDTITSTSVNGTTGFFRLAFLPPGIYSISVSDTSRKSFQKSGVAVTAGNDNSLGQVTLQ
ncbi:MAG: DUF4382 domain-containing protein [candidate division KSB1 bacterium]|nr:DUF4382 domain-containing protein [candidate division KSB1 bacterium]MDZ7301573.1 DUF4382 domain-containing protein [candidate division KSB1 bacterium]MDZ7311011.1 DUF4382 domain-containing protein [candidate division KSB1 bacterium]